MPGGSGSTVLVEEIYASQADRFLAVLRTVRNPKRLGEFTDRWKKDLRPWARAQIINYVRLPLTSPQHEPAAKPLFKHFEETRGHAMMGVFTATFDRGGRRKFIRGFIQAD